MLLLWLPLHPLNGQLIDSYFRVAWWQAPDPRFFLISLGETEYDVAGEPSLNTLSQLLAHLNRERPKAIGILADIDARQYAPSELDRLVSVVDASIPVLVGYTEESSLGRAAPKAFGDRITFSAGIASRDAYSFGADSVTRRVMVEIDRFPTFYARLATYLRGSTPERVETQGTSKHAYIRWQGPPGTYPIHSVNDVLNRRDFDGKLAGKTILIGYDRADRLAQDFVLTPYSRNLGSTTLLEAAAHGLATLTQDDGLLRPPFWLVGLLTVVVALCTVNAVYSMSPTKGILFTFSCLLLLWLGGLVAFLFGGWSPELAHPAVVVFSTYYLAVPFRLAFEYRERWRFQQSNEMLSQLEHMKSCFLALVSHDLKTPIARIQGYAELLQRDEALATEKSQRGVAAILSSTQQMSDYVESILELTRIESGQVPLKKESRDLNSALGESIEEKRILAAEKNIEIQSQLEPLFSTEFDYRLMRRVFSNLIENAIKYSPPATGIFIRSREENAHVVVTIEDHGAGISPDDQKRVFSKFFRSENPALKSTKGTGLGLYLVKYFVELHKGEVSLTSELGRGSTFRVSLPI